MRDFEWTLLKTMSVLGFTLSLSKGAAALLAFQQPV